MTEAILSVAGFAIMSVGLLFVALAIVTFIVIAVAPPLRRHL